MDTVARLAGDEFIVLLENIVIPGDAISVAERIRSRLGQGVKIGNETLSLTCSIGITFGIREYGTDVAKPIHDADIAMYRSKEGGRNRVSLANGHTR
jgi:diguanylate cyclase (GGDEF)-like protein